MSDIQDYFQYILKNHNKNVDNPSIRIYVNKIENRITFKIKNRHYRELLTPETMKLLGGTESKITKDKNCLLDYPYFKDSYKLIAIDLSKQQALDADPRAN